MEPTANEATNGAQRKVRGRKAKTSDHQEAIIKLEELNPLAIATLIADFRAAHDASEIFNEGIKANADRAGVQAAVLRKFVTARAGDSFNDKKRDAMQLSLLFEEIGE
jgi:hypothetical protein